MIKTIMYGRFYDEDLKTIIQIQLLLGIALFFVWSGSKYMLRDDKFKFSIMLPALILVNLTTTIGVIWDESKVLSTKPGDRVDYLQFITIGYIEIFIIPIIISVFIFKYMLTLMDPFNKEIQGINLEIEKENYNVRITNEEMLNDSSLGPMSNFINNLLIKSSSLINDLKKSIILINSISEELINATKGAIIATDEVSNTSQSMAKGASDQTELIQDALEEMMEVNSLLTNIIKQIQASTESTSQIALQTNILALNAGIEASRAGDYGRGFAVVADNVRKLSDQSKFASERINEIVETMSITLQNLFESLQRKITNIAAVSEETAASSEEVAASSEEMRSNIDELLMLASKLNMI